MRRKILFRCVVCFAMATLALMPVHTRAQGKIICSFDCRSGNLWSASVLGYATDVLDHLIMPYESWKIFKDDPIGLGLRYRTAQIKDDGKKVAYKDYNMFGFKAVDLFRDLEYSFKVGWQPMEIPVGFYARIGYQHENFKTRKEETDSWTKHRLDCIRPGIGIRISPLDNLLKPENGIHMCPIVEIGSYYDIYFHYKGAYDGDKKQLNNGLTTHLGLGIKMADGISFMINWDRQNYDLFNRDFSVDDYKPYERTKTRHSSFSVTCDVAI